MLFYSLLQRNFVVVVVVNNIYLSLGSTRNRIRQKFLGANCLFGSDSRNTGQGLKKEIQREKRIQEAVHLLETCHSGPLELSLAGQFGHTENTSSLFQSRG